MGSGPGDIYIRQCRRDPSRKHVIFFWRSDASLLFRSLAVLRERSPPPPPTPPPPPSPPPKYFQMFFLFDAHLKKKMSTGFEIYGGSWQKEIES